MKKVFLSVLVLGLISCGGGGAPLPPATPTPPPPPSPPPPPITVSVSPASATLPAGTTQQFTATVQNTTNTAVTWQVNGITGGDSTVGMISTSGDYTAPLSPPETGVVTVTAVSQADSTKSGLATATIVFSNATLSGQYAFSFSGVDTSGFFLVAGSFTADGNGTLSNGVEDLNHGTGVFPNLSFTGSYSIGPDGRGTATITSSQGTSNLRFVVLSNDLALFIQFDTFANGLGTIARQDTSAFANSALVGGYSFGLDGLSVNGPLSTAGRFTLDGVGGIAAGVQDINDGGFIAPNVPFTGTYNISSNGRGTAALTTALGTSNFAFYMVSGGQAFFLQTDIFAVTTGTVTAQAGTPFTTASVSGSFGFGLGGVTTVGPIDLSGQVTANGAGTISGTEDVNDAGTLSQDVSLSGSYAVASNGRGTATLTTLGGTSQLRFYVVSASGVVLVGVDSTEVVLGAAGKQF